MSYLKDFIPQCQILFKGKTEASAEAEAILPDYYPTVMRIIRTEACPFLRSKTVYGDTLALEGNVEFRVLYQSEKGEINSFFYKAPFSQSVEIPRLQDTVPEVSVALDYKDIRALSPQKLSFRAALSLYICAIKAENKEILAEDKEKRGRVAVLSAEESFSFQIASTSKMFRHSGEISFEQKTPIEKIISYDISFTNTDFKPMNKKVLVKSDMEISLLYLSTDKKPQKTEEKAVISQLLDLDATDTEAMLFARPSLCDCRFDLKENGEGKVLAVEYNMEIEFSLYQSNERRVSLLSDAFGVGCDVEITKERVLCERRIPQNQTVFFEETFDIGSFTEIYDITATPTIKESVFDREKDVFDLNGDFAINIIFCDREGEILSAEKRFAFSLKNNIRENITSLRQSLYLSVRNLSFEMAEGKVNVKIEAFLTGEIYEGEEREIISGLTEKELETEEEDDSHLVLYYATKGERLWDIAKKYRTAPEEIAKANGINEALLGEERMLFISKYII